MRILSEQKILKRCIIGEGPVWNEKENRLYYTNGFGNEICMYHVEKDELMVRPVEVGCSAFAFDKQNRLIVTRPDGVFILNDDDSITDIYDKNIYKIQFPNDMKVGPDGRIYVGTQSEKRKGVSDKINGKLYCIDKDGVVKVLLDNLILSNGMEWSMDEKHFYHTDSDTNIIKEYDFDREKGEITFTGREIYVPGVDGFTIDKKDHLLIGCWGQGHVAVVDIRSMEVIDYIEMPCRIPSSCGFAGPNMDILAVTTANYGTDPEKDPEAGFTVLMKREVGGRKPYLFG